ncbi:hypothetical protein ACJX0J_018339, partial [Zea mays]
IELLTSAGASADSLDEAADDVVSQLALQPLHLRHKMQNMFKSCHFKNQAAAQQEGVTTNKYAQRNGSISSDWPGINREDS